MVSQDLGLSTNASSWPVVTVLKVMTFATGITQVDAVIQLGLDYPLIAGGMGLVVIVLLFWICRCCFCRSKGKKSLNNGLSDVENEEGGDPENPSPRTKSPLTSSSSSGGKKRKGSSGVGTKGRGRSTSGGIGSKNGIGVDDDDDDDDDGDDIPVKSRVKRVSKGSDTSSLADRKDRFLTLMIQEPGIFYIVGELVPADRVEDVARAHIRVMEGNKQIHTLIMGVLDAHFAEEAHRSLEGALPSKTYPTSVLSLYLRLIGIGYLRKLLGGPLKQLYREYHTEKQLSIEAEHDAVAAIASSVVDALVESPCPSMIQDVAAMIRTSLRSARLGELQGPVVGRNLLTRFVLPAVAVPHAFAVMKGPPPDAIAASMVKASKLISWAATNVNGSGNGFDEWMKEYSDVTAAIEKKVRQFVRGIGGSKPPPPGKESPHKVVTRPDLAQQALEHTFQTCLGRAVLIQDQLRGSTEEAWASIFGMSSSSESQDTLDSVSDITDMTDTASLGAADRKKKSRRGSAGTTDVAKFKMDDDDMLSMASGGTLATMGRSEVFELE